MKHTFSKPGDLSIPCITFIFYFFLFFWIFFSLTHIHSLVWGLLFIIFVLYTSNFDVIFGNCLFWGTCRQIPSVFGSWLKRMIYIIWHNSKEHWNWEPQLFWNLMHMVNNFTSRSTQPNKLFNTSALKKTQKIHYKTFEELTRDIASD